MEKSQWCIQLSTVAWSMPRLVWWVSLLDTTFGQAVEIQLVQSHHVATSWMCTSPVQTFPSQLCKAMTGKVNVHSVETEMLWMPSPSTPFCKSLSSQIPSETSMLASTRRFPEIPSPKPLPSGLDASAEKHATECCDIPRLASVESVGCYWRHEWSK